MPRQPSDSRRGRSKIKRRKKNMMFKNMITRLKSRLGSPLDNIEEDSPSITAASQSPVMKDESRPEGWVGKPYRWKFHDHKFSFQLDDGTPVFWADCYKPDAYHGGYRTNFQTRVLVHPSDGIGWMLLEMLTLKSGGIHQDQLGEYRLRRATKEECLPFFPDDDPAITYRQIEMCTKPMQHWFDESGRRRTL